MPGVSAAENFDTKNKGLLAGVDFSVNGNYTTGNLFLVDGVNNNDIGSNRTILVYPSIDAIQEFKILRNSYGPEYGQSMGGVVSIVTRGGTNKFHGSAFYNGRNDVLNATDFFNNLNGQPKDSLRRNDWGYTVGGPAIKDKLFFFWSQEWNREIRGRLRSAAVPTAAEKLGDFSNIRTASDGSACEPTPLVGGNPATAVPAGQLSPAGLLVVQLYPDPNIPDSQVQPGSCNNWAQSFNSPIYWRQENIRGDYKLGSTWSLMGRYTHDSWSQPFPILPNAFWGDDPFPAVETSWAQPGSQATVKITKLFGNSAVNDFQVSYAANKINVTRAGTNPGLNDQINQALLPNFPFSVKHSGADMGHALFWGGVGAGVTGGNLWTQGPWQNNEQLFIYKDDFSKVAGAHTFKLGVLFTNNQKNELTAASSGENVQFGGVNTNDTGNGAFNVLWNQVVWNGLEAKTNPNSEGRWHDVEFYYGDTWKVRRNLTVDYGFRWSFLRQPYHGSDAMSNFVPSLYDPALGADSCNGLAMTKHAKQACQDSGFLGGTVVSDRSLKANDNHSIAPRIGIAWDPKGDGKMSIRAGVGQFFQRDRVSSMTAMSSNPPFSVLFSNANRTLDVPLSPIGVSGSPTTAIDPSHLLPNTWQWNLTVERELLPNTKVELSYVGNRGIHLQRWNEANAVAVTDRFEYATNNSDSTNNNARNSLRPFGAGNWGRVQLEEWKASANYHALQGLFRTRMKSVDAQLAYTFSKSLSDTDLTSSGNNNGNNSLIDPFNPRLSYGPTYINRPHVFVSNIVYNMPSFSGHNALTRYAVGGWQLAGILNYTSGVSMSVFANGGVFGAPGGFTGTGTNNGTVRPNRVAGQSCRASRSSSPLQWLNPNAWTLTDYRLTSFGTAGVGECFGPGIANTDFSVHKNFRIAEKANVQFRMDFFNFFNKTQFRGNTNGNANINNNLVNGSGSYACTLNAQFNDVTGPNATAQTQVNFAARCPSGITNRISWNPSTDQNQQFGQVTADRGPREIQYSLKIEF
jgi:hypothetical protein